MKPDKPALQKAKYIEVNLRNSLALLPKDFVKSQNLD